VNTAKISYPDKYECAYCGSTKRGHDLIRSEKFYRPHFACGECKAKNKSKIIGKAGWIYMIGYDSFWKIGRTCKDPILRLGELQNGNPNELVLAASKIVDDCLVTELFAHRKLSDRQIRGEWFRGTEDEIKSIVGFSE